MNIRKLILATGILTAFTLGSCNKYEDGPAIVLESKKSRIANVWEVEKALNNGEDVTDQYDQFTLKMTKSGDAELAALYTLGDFSFEYDTDGTWEFDNEKEDLVLDFENNAADVEYQILRLTKDELWLREKGGEDEIRLETK